MVQLDDDAASDVLDSTSNPEADNYVELATDEQALFDAAKSQLDWDVIDAVTLATQDQPGYTPEERSQNATKQVRDSGGKFARSGNQVTKQDGTKATIKSVNHDGSIEVENSSGKTDKVNAADVTVSPVIAKLSQPLPLIQDPGAVIDAYLKSVQEQRKAEPPAAAPTTAAGDPAPAPVETAVGPDNSDVAPLYLAVVDAHDASAVLDLVALVPPGPNDPPGAVTGWNRKDGKWVSDPHIIEDLRGSTPPPVVQLDAATEQEVVQQVDAAQSQAQPTTAAGSLFPSGAMIALYPPSNVTPQLTAIGGTDGTSPDDLHVTLVYFGDVDELAASTDLDQLAAAVGEFASRTAALEGEISGVGRFSGDSDMGDPWYASVDVPGLVQFRNSLLDLLDDLGVSYKTNHGFTPHITLGYLDQSATTPVDRINSIPVSFGNLSLALGETVVTFPFGGSDELPELGLEPLPDMDFSGDELEPQLWGEDGSLIVAAAGVDTHPAAAERLRIYWAHGEGAAKIKWGVPGDWKRCVHHLEKFMGVRAKGYCTLRHHDALGVYPGQEDGGRGHKKHFSYEDATAFVAKQFEAITAAGANYPATVEQVQKGVPFVIPVLVPEGVETGDGRSFAQGALTTRTLPLPLLWQQRTQDGHDESVIVGRIDSIDRLEAGGLGNARGVFDTGEHAQEAVRLIRNLMLSGVSADLDSFEARPIKSTTDETKEDSDAITSEKMEITSARLMAATLVAKPAFQECRIKLVEDGDAVPDGDYSGEVSPVEASALVACAAVLSSVPVNPPKTWFENPNLDKPTHLTVTDDGRVYGHIAAWHVDHVGLPMGTKPPRSASNYAYFRTGVIRTQEGDDIPVGQITLTGGHAPLSATASEAVRHYDDTKSAMCDVAAGEDEFGIWVAGALRPDASPQQLRAFRAASPSGDWRPIKGKLELVAVCQVNVPGFPVVRARVASGAVTALVAAGAATLAHLRVDPYSTETLAARVAALEGERLNEKAAKIRERMAPILASRKATEFDIADIIGDDEPDPVDGMDQLEPMDDAAPEATDLVSAVTALFASTVTFYLKAHGYHWNVRGGDFREYHGLFEEIYDDVYNAVDPMAEILQKLGAPSPYKLTEFANLTRVQDADPGTDVASMVQDLVDANEVVLGQIVAAFDMATQASEQGAASFLADRQDMHQKWRWFLNASLNKAAVTAALAAGDLATAKAMLASRVEPIRNERVAALSAKAAELSTRVMGKTKDERKAELLAQREALVARVGLAEAPPLHVPEGDWKEALHPRDDHGQFRDVLFHLTGLLHSSDPGASGVVAEVAKAADAQDAGNNTQAKELGHGAIAKLNDLIGKADSPEQHARLTQAVDALTHTVTTTPDAPPVEDHILTKPAEDTTNYVIEQLKTSVDPGAKQLLKKLERATGQAGAVSPQEIAAWLAEAMRYIVTPDAMQRPLQPQIPTP
jgi:DNA-binding ferritin-like protein/2'-5' RNA ligase